MRGLESRLGWLGSWWDEELMLPRVLIGELNAEDRPCDDVHPSMNRSGCSSTVEAGEGRSECCKLA